jgi:hypothetical protein
MESDLSIEERVFLLAIYTKEPKESLTEVLHSLVNTGMFSKKRGKKVLQMLEEKKFVVDKQLSFKGVAEAKKAKEEFTL